MAVGAIAPALGAAAQIGTGIASGIGGKQAQKRANQMGDEALGIYRRQAELNLGTGDYLRNQAEMYSNPALGARLTNDAFTTGDTLRNIANVEAGNIGNGSYMNDAAQSIQGAGNFNEYDFAPVENTRQQALAFANETAANARRDALAQQTRATSQQGTALDAQLAQRGLSRDSGAAAGALSQFARENALTNAQLESNLAQMTGQLGMQASQFDVSSALQMAGLGSQYNLGMNQLRSTTGIQQGQALAGLQSLQDQQALQRAQLQSNAELGALGAAQGAYQANYLTPMMGAQQNLATLGSYAGGYAQSGMSDLIKGAAGSAGQGGAGKGAAIGGLSGQGGTIDQLTSALTGKNTPTQGGTNPGFGVSYRG